MNEILFIFLSRVHIWGTYPVKIHLASNAILFHVIRGYNGPFRISVISNLGAIALYALSTFETVSTNAFYILDCDDNISTTK